MSKLDEMGRKRVREPKKRDIELGTDIYENRQREERQIMQQQN